MREHMGLYRGKRKDNGEWVEGFYVRNGDKHDIVNFMEPKNNKITLHGYGEAAWTTTIVVQHEVDPDTVGECIGLQDRCGKMAYEHHITEDKQGRRWFIFRCPGGFGICRSYEWSRTPPCGLQRIGRCTECSMVQGEPHHHRNDS